MAVVVTVALEMGKSETENHLRAVASVALEGGGGCCIGNGSTEFLLTLSIGGVAHTHAMNKLVYNACSHSSIYFVLFCLFERQLKWATCTSLANCLSI